jgi:hypothetical protein
MSRLILRALSLAIISAVLPLSNALAHCVVGARFLPATIATDDPCVADEMSLPTETSFQYQLLQGSFSFHVGH